MKPPTLPPRSNFAQAMRAARRAIGSRQDEFDLVSSRTYVSALERGIKSPTLPKVDDLATVLQIHPLSLLTLSYLQRIEGANTDLDKLLADVRSEVAQIIQATDEAVP